MKVSKKQSQAANMSSEELTCNSYNTTEEEEDETKKDSLYKIQLRKEKMNKFFIENPYLEGQIDLNSNDVYINKDIHPGKIGQTYFLEDLENANKDGNAQLQENTNKYWEMISKEVDSTYNIKKKTKAKTLDQIMKRINIFKSRLDTLDRNPILKKILETNSYEDSEAEREKEEEKKKKKAKEDEEFVFYSYKKRMQNQYKELLKNNNKDKMQAKAKIDTSNQNAKKKKPVHQRLANNGNDQSEEETINVEDNLHIRYESGKELYRALKDAKNEREYRNIARTHWIKFKKEYKESLAQYKQEQFVQKFVKENKKYNIYLPDFNQEKQKHLNLEEDEAKQKELMNEDEEIFNMIDKIMTGAVYQKWKSLQDKDI